MDAAIRIPSPSRQSFVSARVANAPTARHDAAEAAVVERSQDSIDAASLDGHIATGTQLKSAMAFLNQNFDQNWQPHFKTVEAVVAHARGDYEPHARANLAQGLNDIAAAKEAASPGALTKLYAQHDVAYRSTGEHPATLLTRVADALVAPDGPGAEAPQPGYFTPPTSPTRPRPGSADRVRRFLGISPRRTLASGTPSPGGRTPSSPASSCGDIPAKR